ncbi:competence protein CoiA [Enterococcus sp. AZ020]
MCCFSFFRASLKKVRILALEVITILNAYTEDKELITLLHKTREEIDELKGVQYFCPICEAVVQIKNGRIKIPHFAHYNRSHCPFAADGETQEHLSLKEMFAAWCESEGLAYELEKYLPEINQRPDLLIGKIAVEFQCSPLSLSRLIERSKNYRDNGYQVVWICGKKLLRDFNSLTELAKNLCYYSENIGFYLWAADWQKKELSLYFHLEEDWKKRVYSAKKTWPLFTDFLLKIIHFPVTAALHHYREYQVGQLISAYYDELNKKLCKREEQVRLIQSQLYNNHFHILQLPYWFYYPGLHIFCCVGSDMLLKLIVWKWVQFFDQNVFLPDELKASLMAELAKSTELFYDFPNISLGSIQKYCFEQLLRRLVHCQHLIKTSKGWKVNAGENEYCVVDIYKWLKSIEKKRVISATPHQNMIL